MKRKTSLEGALVFHVPECYRILDGPMGSTAAYGNNGAFLLPAQIPGRALWVIASDGMAWEHVSVHVANARNKVFVPCWLEMCYVKNLFYDEEDVVMQLHPRQSEYVNTHPYVLHLWRPTTQEIPTPPGALVG